MPVIDDLSENSKKELLSEALYARLKIDEKIAIRDTILSTLFYYDEHTSADLSCALQCILLRENEIFNACYAAKNPLQESFINTHKNKFAISFSALVFSLLELGAYNASDLANIENGGDFIWNMFIFEFPLIISPLTYHVMNYYLGKPKPDKAIAARAQSYSDDLFNKLSDRLGFEVASALIEESTISPVFAIFFKYPIKDTSNEAQEEKILFILSVLLTWIKEVTPADAISIIELFNNTAIPAKQASSVKNLFGLFQQQEAPELGLRRRQPFQNSMNIV